MMSTRFRPIRAAIAGLLCALLSACTQSPGIQERTFVAFGTLVEVTTYGVEADKAQRVMDAVEDEFNFMHKTWHPWKSSALGRVNKLLPLQEWFSIPPSVRPLVLRSTELYETSGGLFNPAIGKLVQLWGFDSDQPPAGPPPAADAIQELVAAQPSMTDIQVNGIRIRSSNPAVVLDFGGFAKGYGVDRAMELVRNAGIDNAIINAGGDLRAIGSRGERPWRIGIRDPREPGVFASVEIAGDESVFTSGDYERYFDYQNTRYHHILDPRSGYPAQETRSVTIIHDEAAAADAAATALFIAGPGDWHRVAKAMGIRYAMLVDQQGRVHMNPAMAERVRFEGEQRPEVLVSEPL